MNKAQTFQNFVANQSPEISLLWFGINLVFAAFLSFLLALFYEKFGQSLSNRKAFSKNLIFLTMTTMLVIAIVKSSLALSLGLVGALSIVRFRAAIKEPEELAYIFLSIAVGLALGADQRESAALGVAVILMVISLTDLLRTKDRRVDGNLLVTLDLPPGGLEADGLEQATRLLGEVCKEVNMRRIDKGPDRISLTCLARFEGLGEVRRFSKAFEKAFPEGRFTLIDDSTFPNE